MNPYITIPRESLAELLRNAGSPLTPEQYLASLQQVQQASPFRKYRSRAVAAAISKYSLLVVAVAGVFLVPFIGSYVENGIVLAAIWAVTIVEFRVHRYFRENDPRAPALGYWNEALFSVVILTYCIYHAYRPPAMSKDMMMLVETNNLVSQDFIKGLWRTIYMILGVVVGGSQFGLACFYRSARLPADPNSNEAPPARLLENPNL